MAGFATDYTNEDVNAHFRAYGSKAGSKAFNLNQKIDVVKTSTVHYCMHVSPKVCAICGKQPADKESFLIKGGSDEVGLTAILCQEHSKLTELKAGTKVYITTRPPPPLST